MIDPGRLMGGMAVLIAGVLLLLVNLRLIPGLKIDDVMKLWPVLLIFLGIRMIIGKRPLSAWLSIVIILILVIITTAAVMVISGFGISAIN